MIILLSTKQHHQCPSNTSKSALLIGRTLDILSNLRPLWPTVLFVLGMTALQLLHFTMDQHFWMENVSQPLMLCKYRTSIAKWRMKGRVLIKTINESIISNMVKFITFIRRMHCKTWIFCIHWLDYIARSELYRSSRTANQKLAVLIKTLSIFIKKLFQVLFSKIMLCVILQIAWVSLIQYSLIDTVIINTIAKMVPMKTVQGDFQICLIFIIFTRPRRDLKRRFLNSFSRKLKRFLQYLAESLSWSF